VGTIFDERARQAKEAGEADERRDTDQVLEQSSRKTTLGTLGDLLATPSKPKR